MTTETLPSRNGTKKSAESSTSTTTAALDIRPPETKHMLVPITGTAPYIAHRFSEKAKRMMLDNMQGRKNPKESKNPEAEYDAAFYRLDDGRPGIPAMAFKQATVGASRFYGKNVSMVILRMSLFMHGIYPDNGGQALIPITGEPHMREDVVTVGMGGHDLRYRPEFSEWSAVLPVEYMASLLTADSVLSLIQAAGLGVGIGEWRPEKNGDFGTFEIDRGREVVQGRITL